MVDGAGFVIAIALENSRLYEDAREKSGRLQTDLDTAREIPAAGFLPRGAREVPGLISTGRYVPAARNWAATFTFSAIRERPASHRARDVFRKRHRGCRLYGSLAIGMLRELPSNTPWHPPICWLCSIAACMPRRPGSSLYRPHFRGL